MVLSVYSGLFLNTTNEVSIHITLLLYEFSKNIIQFWSVTKTEYSIE